MKNEVSRELESRLGSPLPSGITFSHAGEKTVRLTLGSSAAGLTKHPMNMQQDAAAFEAWALALHTYLDLNLVLDAKLDEPVPGFVRNGVFLPGPGADKASRGYPELNAAIGKTEQIYAYMLADGFHPLISESLLEQMNDNTAPQIRYCDVLYNLNLKVR